MRPRALLFDVFGTCVDWRSAVIRECAGLGLGEADCAGFADAWRGQYQPQLETVRSGRRAWTKLDVLHREALDRVLADFRLEGVPEERRAELNLVWHRLDPWPDTVAGLARLKSRYVIAPCSNGHIALMVDLARHAALPWDLILGAEIARAYKPAPEVYLSSVDALGLAPHEVMMVAAHESDLAAAAGCGLRTAFVPRPDEHGPGRAGEPAPAREYDVVAPDFGALAGALGV